jgi:hypothetical protein
MFEERRDRAALQHADRSPGPLRTEQDCGRARCDAILQRIEVLTTRSPNHRGGNFMRTLLITSTFIAMSAMSMAADGTKFSSAAQCAKSDPEYAVPVNDSTGHVVVVSKTKCSLTGGELNGLALKEQEVTVQADVRGGKSQERGYAVVRVEGGDKAFVSWQGTGSMRDKAHDGEGTWRFTGGTAKLKGLRGHGTYKSTGNADGTASDQIDGEWMIAAAPAKP